MTSDHKDKYKADMIAAFPDLPAMIDDFLPNAYTCLWLITHGKIKMCTRADILMGDLESTSVLISYHFYAGCKISLKEDSLCQHTNDDNNIIV